MQNIGYAPDMYLLARRAYQQIKKYYEENPEAIKAAEAAMEQTDQTGHSNAPTSYPIKRNIKLASDTRYKRKDSACAGTEVAV